MGLGGTGDGVFSLGQSRKRSGLDDAEEVIKECREGTTTRGIIKGNRSWHPGATKHGRSTHGFGTSDDFAHRRLLRLINQRRELLEEVSGVVRAGRGLGVILHGEDRHVLVADAFDRVIVQIDVRDLDIRG